MPEDEEAIATARLEIELGHPLHRSKRVYVDELFVMEAKGAQAKRVGSRNGHQWCHMWSESRNHLLAMGDAIGMKRQWLQGDHPRGMLHYDLVPGRRRKAVELGAIEIPRRIYVMIREYPELWARHLAKDPSLARYAEF